MFRILFVIALVLMCITSSWARVDKLPASHDEHVRQVEAAKSAPRTDPPWAEREGTIKHALTLKNGASVTLDCVHVGAIYKTPQAYFVITEWWDNSEDHTIIVNQAAPDTLRPGQTIDVSGTLTSLSDGRRIIEYPRVLGYTDKNGTLLIRGGPCIKGIGEAVQWSWKTQLLNTTQPKAYNPTTSKEGVKAVSAGTISSNPSPIKNLKSYDSIKALITASPVEGDWVRLRKLNVHLTYTDKNGHYIVVTDASKQYLQVFTAAVPKIATARVGRLIGKVHILDKCIVLLVDTGPTFDPQLGTGDIWIID